jgi:ABC-2 type transport system permease protein
MRVFATLVRRELASCFVSPMGYVIIAGVQFLLGLSLCIVLKALNGKPFDMPVTEVYYNNGLCWLVLLLAPPVITMRTFALEKLTGTYETLMTAPVGDLQVVLAKFTGGLLFYLATWLPLLIYPVILRHHITGPAAVDGGALEGTFVGILLFGAVYVSLGCLASALTRSQIIAAMNTFAAGLGLFLVGYLATVIPPKPGWQAALCNHVSLIEHMKDFTRGILDTRHVLFYATLTLFFLFLTLKAVESRRWR